MASWRAARGAAVLLPFALLVAAIGRYGHNLPWGDDWRMVGLLANLVDGRLGWQDFFAQHNEHRIVFPLLVQVAAALLSRWDIKVQMFLSAGLALATLGLLVVLLKPLLRTAGEPARLWAHATLAAILFSLAQWVNWLWGWQVQWFLHGLATVGCVTLLALGRPAARPVPAVSAAAACAVIAQYSLASGAALWVVALPILWTYPRDRLRLSAGWLAAGAVSSAAYFRGYAKPAGHPPLSAALDDPLGYVSYVGIYMSGVLPKAAWVGLAATAATAGILLYIWRRRPDRWPDLAPWAVLAGYALLNALATGIGRLGLGVHQAETTRYATVALLLLVAAVPVALLAMGSPRLPVRRVGWSAGVLLLLAVYATSLGAIPEIRRFAGTIAAARACFLEYEFAPTSCLKEVFPDVSLVRAQAHVLEQFDWSGFDERRDRRRGVPLDLVVEDGQVRTFTLLPTGRHAGFIDSVSQGGDGTVHVKGWARWSILALGPPRRVILVAGGRVVGRVLPDADRPDVAGVFGDVRSIKAKAWELDIPESDVAGQPIRAYLPVADRVLVALNG